MGDVLRVLHVVVNMNRGGAETFIMNVYRNIDRSKIQFDFLTCREGVFDEEITRLGGRIHRIPYVTDVGHFKYMKQLDSFFQKHNTYRIVHAHMDKMSGLVLRAAKKAEIPIRISHSHSTESEGTIFIKLYKWYIGLFIRANVTNSIACSNNAAKWLFNNQSVKIVKNGINPEAFNYSAKQREQIRSILGINKDTFVVGHIGRFSPIKNHKYLINLFSKYLKHNRNGLLLLVGDGPLRKELEEQVQQLNIREKVIFTGVRSDVSDLIQSMDVLVFPSIHEGLPVTLIEAQGSGLPCIISDTISTEVDLGLNLIEFLSLENFGEWIKRLISLSEEKIIRTSNLETFVQQGYSIKETATDLKEYYLSLTGDVNEKTNHIHAYV